MIECLTCETVDLAGLPNAAHDKLNSKISTTVTLIFSAAEAATLIYSRWRDRIDSIIYRLMHICKLYAVIQS